MATEPQDPISGNNENTVNIESEQPQELITELAQAPTADLAELVLSAQELEEDEDTELNHIREEISEWNAAEENPETPKAPLAPEINLKGKDDVCDKIFLKDLPKMYLKKSPQLDPIFKRDLLINVDRKYYHCSFMPNELIVTKENKKAETQMNISAEVLEKILNSQLNPQIALLNNKISIEGNFSTGLYFFNLLNL